MRRTQTCQRPQKMDQRPWNSKMYELHKPHTEEAEFSFPGGGGGGDRALRPDPPLPQKGSIHRTPKILPRLTPGPRR